MKSKIKLYLLSWVAILFNVSIRTRMMDDTILEINTDGEVSVFWEP